MSKHLKTNLQLFASDPGVGEDIQDPGDGQQASVSQPVIDYDKIQNMIDKGAQQKENAILKSYFQQQGLSKDEVEQAIATFKQQKAEATPDVQGLQTQVQTLQQQAQQAIVEKDATVEAIALGLDAKQVPYILKMADFSKGIGEDGKTNQEALKEAINKILEDFPQLKPEQKESKGFQKIGADGQDDRATQSEKIVPQKRWNRFNQER